MTTGLANPVTAALHAATHLPAGTDAVSWASGILQRGLDASKPAAASSNAGELYSATDTGVTYQSTGSAWVVYAYDSWFETLLNGGAGNTIRECYPRMEAQALGAYVTNGVMFHHALGLVAGDVVTNLSFATANVTPGGIANWWVALYDTQATPALMAQSANQGAAALPNLSMFTIALSAPQTITVTGLYYAAVMINATTPPSFMCHNSGVAAMMSGIGTQKRIQGTSGSGLTTTAPATIATPAATNFGPWMAAS